MSTDASVSQSIPIDFKVKVAKEVYEALPPDQKQQVIDRIKEDYDKLYRPISNIADIAERDKKLAAHEL